MLVLRLHISVDYHRAPVFPKAIYKDAENIESENFIDIESIKNKRHKFLTFLMMITFHILHFSVLP